MSSKEWNHWNVALWINNDLGYWSLAQDCLRQCKTLTEAAERFCEAVGDMTPDGAKFTKAAVRAALRDMRGPM